MIILNNHSQNRERNQWESNYKKIGRMEFFENKAASNVSFSAKRTTEFVSITAISAPKKTVTKLQYKKIFIQFSSNSFLILLKNQEFLVRTHLVWKFQLEFLFHHNLRQWITIFSFQHIPFIRPMSFNLLTIYCKNSLTSFLFKKFQNNSHLQPFFFVTKVNKIQLFTSSYSR